MGPGVLPRVLPGFHPNHRENPVKPDEKFHFVADPSIALQQSRHGGVLRPRRDPDFNYSNLVLNSVLPLHSSTLHDRDHYLAHFAVLLPFHNNSGSSSTAIQGSAFPKLRKLLKEPGEQVFYLKISPRSFRW